tara:strand:+ start:3393 stop:6830 length:3438 start_codon:yes stop_codon:yes gene_type:complete
VAEETKFTEEQQKDFERLLELQVKPKDAKNIILGVDVELPTVGDTTLEAPTGKQEKDIDRKLLAEEGYSLDLIEKATPKAEKSYSDILTDDVGIETESQYVPLKTLYNLEGVTAEKETELSNDIRFKAGFGLSGDEEKSINIKDLLIRELKNKYGDEEVEKYKDKIDVKYQALKFKNIDKKGLVYKIPTELGGNGLYAAVDSPDLSLRDFSDLAADSGPIVASIIGGTFGSTLGPVGTIGGSAVSAGLTEYARLMYGYHKLGLMNEQFTPEQFNELALAKAVKYGAIDAAATGAFLSAAKLVLPTILGKNQLSTKTISDFIETKGRTDDTVFSKVNKVKDKMKKQYNLTDSEADKYFAVSVGKALIEPGELGAKTSAVKKAILSDEIGNLKTKAEIKGIEDKILKKATGLKEVDNVTADSIIETVENQVKGQAQLAVNTAEINALNTSKQVAELEKSFVDDFATKYLDEFGVYLDDTYRALQSELKLVDDNLATLINKNKDPIDLNLNETFRILEKEIKKFDLKGLLPKGLKKIPGQKAKPENIQKAIDNNVLFNLRQLFDEAGFSKMGIDLKNLEKGFKLLSKKGNITIKQVYTLKNAVDLLEQASVGTKQGVLRNLSGKLNKNIAEALAESGDDVLAKAFKDKQILLELKRNSIFDNFSNEFAGGKLAFNNTLGKQVSESEALFTKLVSDSIESRKQSAIFGKIFQNETGTSFAIPTNAKLKIEQALYRNYFNNVIEQEGIKKMSHQEFFNKFGKNYENILGKEKFSKLKNTSKVLDEYEKLNNFRLDQNAVVQKALPGITWDAIDSSGPGQIVDYILKSGVKSNNLKLLTEKLPSKTVNDIRTIFLRKMMSDVNGSTYEPGIAKYIGARQTDTLNGAKLNAFLDKNRSTILQLYDKEFFSLYRDMANVLEMLQSPAKGIGVGGGKTITDVANQAGLFVDIFAGPLNHKRLILNRAARILDSFNINADNLMLFTDYNKFIKAAKNNFLGGNYPRFMDQLPGKTRENLIDKVLKSIKKEDTAVGKFLSKEANLDNIINRLNLGFNKAAGLRKGYTLNPLRNPLVGKEFAKDKFEEVKDKDPMEGDADIFFPADITGRFAIEALQSLISKGKKAKKFIFDEPEKEIKKYEERNLEKEKFEKELNE